MLDKVSDVRADAGRDPLRHHGGMVLFADRHKPMTAKVTLQPFRAQVSRPRIADASERHHAQYRQGPVLPLRRQRLRAHSHGFREVTDI